MHIECQEDAVNLVKQIFQSMGGRIIPANRPGHIDKYSIMTPERDAFIMDLENTCLSQHWGKRPHPKGNKRYENPEWAILIQSKVYPHHSDIDWDEYCEWISRGYGDEFFQEDAEEYRSPTVSIENERCMGCGRGDSFCRCGAGPVWFGDDDDP